MSKGWLQGKTVRKGGIASNGRANTPHTVQSTSSTIFGGGVKDPSGRTSEYFSMDDVCPVCKSDRYLNPKLRLLVSSCYHKMCESCIDRLFTLGPAPCPICQKVLRKLAFTPQTFEDLGVEKEVAIRRRIAKEFNKRREDFPDLRSFNDYLEEVEDIVARLYPVSHVPYPEAEEREERERSHRDILEGLEAGGAADTAKVIARSRAAALKRASARTASASAGAAASFAQLLRARAAPGAGAAVPDVPHVPLQDEWDACEGMYELRAAYADGASDAVRRDREGIMRAGGYQVQDAWDRAIRCAVAGLDVPPLVGLDGGGAGAGEMWSWRRADPKCTWVVLYGGGAHSEMAPLSNPSDFHKWQLSTCR
ncbi:CDK-activating kinase assembly factor [Athelia psychrophila]|uniref:RNA polymerase II transcription factor B subunit 3 n=1 Tax=Athelia psychrophila TaxID=1759441 RepID=A0A167TBD9_9AGAM|nr:CDK-activating kinase assembly factor [Fibularhizoctonia sp. CBS 109695]